MALFANRYFLFFLGLYILSFLTLTLSGVYSIAEPLFILGIFGLIIPGVAYFFSRKCPSIPIRVKMARRELSLTFLYILFITAFLVWGGGLVNSFVYSFVEETPQFDFFFDIIKKLVVFVLIPYFLFSRMFGYSWKDFGFSTNLKKVFAPRTLVLMAVLFVLFFLIQFFIGQGAQPLFNGEFPLSTILLGGLLLFPLLVIEVGLVEEFFFRGIVQARMAVWLKSEVAGIFVMALIFGLAHAPGLYLRGAGAVTALGETPSLLSAVSYSIAVLSLAGLAFGVIWAKTKNIVVLMLIHAWVDLLPLLPEFIRIFGL